ncbi:MAG: hypothetical protein ISR69_06850 [Gammaproteobacteria bacterium]|nr:hypothetical protein [Gammaproteobacteria bacterium]
MDIKTILLVVIAFSIFLFATIYFKPSSTEGHGHSHGQAMQETENDNKASTTHETIK